MCNRKVQIVTKQNNKNIKSIESFLIYASIGYTTIQQKMFSVKCNLIHRLDVSCHMQFDCLQKDTLTY